MQLSESQTAAVYSDWRNTVSLVLSTAGSGKTRALTCRAVRIAAELVREKKLNSRVLCICFNVSAAQEMVERITDLVQETDCLHKLIVTRHALQPKEMVVIEVRTFHALGYWILRSANGSERERVGLRRGTLKLLTGIAHTNVVIEALQEAGVLSPSEKKREKNSAARKYQANFSEYKRFLLERECEHYLPQYKGESQQPLISRRLISARAFELYKQRMQELNGITYDDMIAKSVSLLQNAGRIREAVSSRYQAVLVDEFQDLTPAEFVMCKAFVETSKALTMVGDDDQQIYSFRSSRTWFCHEMVATWFRENINVLQLPENRRCPGAVIKSAAAVVARNSRRAPKSILPVLPVGNPVRIIGCQTDKLEILFVINRIKSLLPIVRKKKQQILVLFRTNLLLNIFQKQFRLADVATSRVLVDPEGEDDIGSKTSATFALICLMSRKIDRATFLWAITTVSDLHRDVVEGILESSESSETVRTNGSSTEVGSNCNENNKRLRQDGNMASTCDVSDKPYPSQYLEKLTNWYRANRSEDMDSDLQKTCHNLHNLLGKTERLTMAIRKVDKADKMARIAEEIISVTSPGEYEDFIQHSQDERTEKIPETIADGKGGFDLIISVARKIDENAQEEWEEAAECLRDTAAPNSKQKSGKEDDDATDFAGLFDQDKNLAKKKRGNSGTNSNADASVAVVRRRMMGKKIDELCETLLVTMTRSGGSERTKLSRSERPSTVLSTIHKAKGTSFAYVFLCGANTVQLPVAGALDLELASCNGEVPREAREAHSLRVQEERRLFFVSLTRTMIEFTCTYSPGVPCVDDIKKWRSIFITEMLDGIGDSKHLATEWFVHNKRDVFATVKKLQQASADALSESKCKRESDESACSNPNRPDSTGASSGLTKF
eukprot:GFKZ01000887.1.p1 GENE.GFKZ01000887.1~~GFKZ01000887.1.p1  ORF type:complete len:896 (+),score=121.00 GFKZ01000887.1:390-3077(+)